MQIEIAFCSFAYFFFFFCKEKIWQAIYRNLLSFVAVVPNFQAVPETERERNIRLDMYVTANLNIVLYLMDCWL